MEKNSLGNRMKMFYEDRSKTFLIRRAYTIIRIDGKAFHTYTKGLDVPFDEGLIDDMDETTKFLCQNIQGAKFGFVQSDEISIMVSDFDELDTDMWFDGNIQKITSVSASLATSKFNQLRILRSMRERENLDLPVDSKFYEKHFKIAQFDSRVFQIPSPVEVENYFIYRQQDCTRNSISAVAQSLYSHKELKNKNTNEQQEMIFQKGRNWNNYTSRKKRGGFVCKQKSYIGGVDPATNDSKVTIAERTFWNVVDCPIFTQNREFLTGRIPTH